MQEKRVLWEEDRAEKRFQNAQSASERLGQFFPGMRLIFKGWKSRGSQCCVFSAGGRSILRPAVFPDAVARLPHEDRMGEPLRLD
jgi:phosphoserine phosphatase